MSGISSEYGTIIKSWGQTNQQYEKLKAQGKILAERDFKHPILTPVYFRQVESIKNLSKLNGKVFIAGAWTQSYEIQSGGVQSGFEAARFVDPKISIFWKTALKHLKGTKAN